MRDFVWSSAAVVLAAASSLGGALCAAPVMMRTAAPAAAPRGAPDAAGASPSDAHAIEIVIRARLDAFSHDPAGKAFAYAAPGIRQMIGTPANFVAIVKYGYPVAHRRASPAFRVPVADGGQVFQPVRMSDADGVQWTAIHVMQRQSGSNWLTGELKSGCQLVRGEGRLT